jgi:hypothetical protein
MYSFDNGRGVGFGAIGFQLFGAFFATVCPNHPVRLPDIGSVVGNHPFLAKMPAVTNSTKTSASE